MVNDYTPMMNDNHATPDLWTVKLNFPHVLSGEQPELLSNALEDVCVSVFLHNHEHADGDNWTVTLTTMGPPDKSEIRARVEGAGLKIDDKNIIAEKLPPKDWLQHVHDNFPPVRIGQFFVYGSHYKGALPQDAVPLQIDAATAFGSGEHETTKGCIQALEYLKAKGLIFKNGLDMGCGSGILAIVQIMLWPDDVCLTAIDIDPESVRVTERHTQMNGVFEKIYTEAGDGYNAAAVTDNGPYDIVTANILAGPLIDMAPQLYAVLEKGGYAILSGLLKRQKNDVVAAHKALGMKLVHAEEIGDWQALILQK